MCVPVSRGKVINGSKKIIENYKPRFKVDPNWNYELLSNVAKICCGDSAPQDKKYFTNSLYPFVRMSDVEILHLSNNLIDTRDKINDKAVKSLKLNKWPKNTILFPKSGASIFSNHRVMLGMDTYVSSHLATIIAKKNICTIDK